MAVRDELMKLLREDPQVIVQAHQAMTQEQEAAKSAEVLEGRKVHAGLVASTLEQQLKDQKPAIAALEKAKNNTKAKQKELDAAQAEERAAYGRLWNLNMAAERVVSKARAELSRTAPEILDVRRKEYLDRLEEGRKTLRPFTEGRGDPNWQGDKTGPYYSNRPSIVAHMDALRAAVETVEALKFEALTDEELTKRLAQIEATIPDPNIEVKVGD